MSGLSLHKEKVQVNAFKDNKDILLSRVQNFDHDGISTPYLRFGDKSQLTDKELTI